MGRGCLGSTVPRSFRDGVVNGRALALWLAGLKPLEFKLLLSNHMEETVDMRFLFRFQFLMELAQARGPVMMGICQQRRAGEWLRAGSTVCRMLVDHLAWGRHGGIVEVEVHEDDGSSTARLRGGTVSREGGARGSARGFMLEPCVHGSSSLQGYRS